MPAENLIPAARIVVDAALAQKLNGLAEPMEFHDEFGNLLGRFSPSESSPAFRTWLRKLDHGLTPQQVEDAITSRKGLSTEELTAKLREQQP